MLMLLCFVYYAKTCLAICGCFKYENKIIFNESTNSVEIHRNNELIQDIPFNEFDGFLYEDRYVYLAVKHTNYNEPERQPIPFNIYRCDPKRAKDFVLTVTDFWRLIIKKYRHAQFR
eukprot:232832_1